MDSIEVITNSPEETEALGERMGRLLPMGAAVALYGDLAVGKTCLTRGMAAHFGGTAAVHSPTFTLVNEYGKDQVLYHLDLYRLGAEEELLSLGYEDIIESEGVCAIEWADRAPGLLPKRRLDVFMEHAGGDARRLRFVDRGVMPDRWKDALSVSSD